MRFAWFASTSLPFPRKSFKGTARGKERHACLPGGGFREKTWQGAQEQGKKLSGTNQERGQKSCAGGGGSARGEDAVTRKPNHQGQSSVSSHVSLHTVTSAASLPLGLSSHLRPPELGSHHPHLPYSLHYTSDLAWHSNWCAMFIYVLFVTCHEAPSFTKCLSDCHQMIARRIMWGR